MKDDTATVTVTVQDKFAEHARVSEAEVCASLVQDNAPKRGAELVAKAVTDENGVATFKLAAGTYQFMTNAFGGGKATLTVDDDCRCYQAKLEVKLGASVGVTICRDDMTTRPCQDLISVGTPIRLSLITQQIAEFPQHYRTTFETTAGRLAPSGGRASVSVRLVEFEQGERGEAILYTDRLPSGPVRITGRLIEGEGSPTATVFATLNFVAPVTQPVSGDVSVTMRRTATFPTPDLPLWVVIRKSTEALSFDRYRDFMNLVLCGIDPATKQFIRSPGEWKAQVFGTANNPTLFETLRRRRFLPYNDADAYRLLKVATEAFVLINCGVKSEALEDFTFTQADVNELVTRVGLDGSFTLEALQELWKGNGVQGYLETVNGVKTLLYLKLVRDKLADVRIKRTLFDDDLGDGGLPEECFGILETKLSNPCLLELIWSYWHEEGMLVQTMNALSVRFQNRRLSERDPLANLEIDPLRPLNNLIWGYVQDEQHRLTLQRRAYEYLHHYGVRLEGRAVPEVRPADTRSKFIEAFHNLLHLCSVFFKQDDDTTFIADGFPVLNALKEVHRIAAEGAHNQFGDLPSTARIEMLMQQWLLARPEFREYLPTRIMVAYEEPWMDRVDAMKKLQGWTDTSVADFHELAVFGEQIVLSIRYGSWSSVDDREFASNWARYWRSEIQGYIHSYRAVTGVDLTAEFTETRLSREAYLPPSVHLRRRLDSQRGASASDRAIPAGSAAGDGRLAPSRMREIPREKRG